jgi:hypothetical protein
LDVHQVEGRVMAPVGQGVSARGEEKNPSGGRMRRNGGENTMAGNLIYFATAFGAG